MKASSGLANLAIEGVLELSADAHIQRKMAARGSSDTALRERSPHTEMRLPCL